MNPSFIPESVSNMLPLPSALKRRGSGRDSMRSDAGKVARGRSGSGGGGDVDDFDLDMSLARQRQRPRSGSIMTPSLVEVESFALFELKFW